MKDDMNLGDCLAEYRKSWALPLVLFLIFAFPAYLLLDAGFGNPVSVIPLLSGIALLGPAALAVADRIRYRVEFHEGGLVQRGLFGETRVRFGPATQFWYSVTRESVNGIPAGTHINIKIRDAGNTVRLRSSIVDIEDLQVRIADVEQKVVGPALRQAYLEGKPVDFAAIKIKKGYLFVGAKALSAAKVSRLELERGLFSVWQAGQKSAFCRIRTAEIANLHVFLGMLSAVTPVGEPEFA